MSSFLSCLKVSKSIQLKVIFVVFTSSLLHLYYISTSTLSLLHLHTTSLANKNVYAAPFYETMADMSGGFVLQLTDLTWMPILVCLLIVVVVVIDVVLMFLFLLLSLLLLCFWGCCLVLVVV